MEVGALIRTTREQAGISQRELAQRAGTSQAAVAKIESGKTSPTVRTVERLMAQMNKQVDLTTQWIDSGVDMSQIASGLRMTPDQRLDRLEGAVSSIGELQRAWSSSRS